MPSPRLFDSTALTPPPEPRVEAMTSNRVLTPEERQAEAERVHRQSMEHYFDSLRRQRLWMTPYAGPLQVMTSHEALAVYLAVGMPAAWLANRMLMRRLEG